MDGHPLRIILRLRPCRQPLWQSQASWLLAWWLGNILIGLLACWVLLSGFCFANTVCRSVCWLIGFWMLVSMPLFWYLQLPRYSPRVAHCFETLGSDRFDGFNSLVGFRCLVFLLSSSSAEMCAGSLAPRCRILCIIATRSWVYGAHGCHVACLVPLLWRVGGPWDDPGTNLGQWKAQGRDL